MALPGFEREIALAKLEEICGLLAEDGIVVGVVLMDYAKRDFAVSHHTATKAGTAGEFADAVVHELFDMVRELLDMVLRRSTKMKLKYTPRAGIAVPPDAEVHLANAALGEALMAAFKKWHDATHNSALGREAE